MLLNRDRTMDYMRRCGLDALVATSPANVTYFSDYHCWIDSVFKEYMMRPGASSDRMHTYVVLPLHGEPALVIDPLLAVNATDVWVQDLQVHGKPGLHEAMAPVSTTDVDRRMRTVLEKSESNSTSTGALINALKARGLKAARIGLEMEGLPAHVSSEIREALPQITMADCTNLMRLIRMVKSKEEISRLTRAAQIAEQAAVEALSLARSGVSIADLVQHYRAQVAGAGADFEHFAYSVRGWGISVESNYQLTDADVLYVDYGCIYNHYYSDTGTTLAMRDPKADVADIFTALRECMDAGIAAIRPGVKVSGVQQVMQATLGQRGIKDAFPHGHGLGLEVRDYPILVPDTQLRIRDDCVDEASDLPLEVDMVFNLEAPVFIPGIGGLHIEQTFVVTADGCRPLVEQKRDFPFVPGEG